MTGLREAGGWTRGDTVTGLQGGGWGRALGFVLQYLSDHSLYISGQDYLFIKNHRLKTIAPILKNFNFSEIYF